MSRTFKDVRSVRGRVFAYFGKMVKKFQFKSVTFRFLAPVSEVGTSLSSSKSSKSEPWWVDLSFDPDLKDSSSERSTPASLFNSLNARYESLLTLLVITFFFRLPRLLFSFHGAVWIAIAFCFFFSIDNARFISSLSGLGIFIANNHYP